VRTRVFAALGLALLVGAGFDAAAQQAPPARLPLAAATSLPRDGTYVANDNLTFVVDHRDGQARLRFSGSDEVFYLSNEAAPLAGRVLKYDTGAVALQVAGWGGVTLYTAAAKSGVPAEYSDVVQNVDPPPVAAKDIRAFAGKLAEELSARDDFAIGFVAGWDDLAQSDGLRALACDAMRNATYALLELAKTAKRALVSDRLHIVKVADGEKPGATVQRGILTVTYARQGGPSARPSSLAIVRVLQASF
jgi:hypothetical protein